MKMVLLIEGMKKKKKTLKNALYEIKKSSYLYIVVCIHVASCGTNSVS